MNEVKYKMSFQFQKKLQFLVGMALLTTILNVSSQTVDSELENFFFENIVAGSTSEVSKALKIRPNLIYAKNDIGETGLTLASLLGQIEVMDLLLKNGASANQTTEDGSTVLHKAMIKGSAKQIALLIEAGANPKAKNDDFETPLSYGVDVGNLAAVAYLSKIIKKFNREIDACDCIYRAVDRGNKEMLVLLLSSGGNPNKKKLDNMTPLMNAAYDRDELLEVLLAAGANRKIKDITGNTALDMARISKNEKAIQILSRP